MSVRAWASFAAVSILWGIPYLLIKVAVGDGVPPVVVALVRVVLGAAVLLTLAWRAGVLGPLRGRFGWITAFAVSEIVLPFPLIAAGERHVDSSMAAILIAVAPLFVALLALRFDSTERVGGRRLAGSFMGLLGVSALVGIRVAGRADELLGSAAILVAAFCYAVGPMILKRHLADLDPRASMGASLAVAAGLLAPVAAFTPPTGWPSATAVGALVALGLLCTAAALVLYAALVAEVGAGRAIVIAYINPVVAVVLGMALLGERPGSSGIAGLVLILVGSWLSTGGHPPPLPKAVECLASSSDARS